jgi:hypothetical protein
VVEDVDQVLALEQGKDLGMGSLVGMDLDTGSLAGMGLDTDLLAAADLDIGLRHRSKGLHYIQHSMYVNREYID